MAYFMEAQKNTLAVEWTFSDNVIPNAHVFDISVNHGGTVVSAPIENGSFVSYNKTAEPLEISCTLAFQGTDAELQAAISNLSRLHQSVATFSIQTPTAEYESMTLESYDYTERREDGRGALYVSAVFREIIEVGQAYTDSELPPITSDTTDEEAACAQQDIGLQQGCVPSDEQEAAGDSAASSILYDIFGG